MIDRRGEAEREREGDRGRERERAEQGKTVDGEMQVDGRRFVCTDTHTHTKIHCEEDFEILKVSSCSCGYTVWEL